MLLGDVVDRQFHPDHDGGSLSRWDNTLQSTSSSHTQAQTAAVRVTSPPSSPPRGLFLTIYLVSSLLYLAAVAPQVDQLAIPQLYPKAREGSSALAALLQVGYLHAAPLLPATSTQESGSNPLVFPH